MYFLCRVLWLNKDGGRHIHFGQEKKYIVGINEVGEYFNQFEVYICVKMSGIVYLLLVLAPFCVRFDRMRCYFFL